MKLNSLQELDIKQTEIFLNKSKVEQIPILDNDGRLLGLFTRKGLEFFKSFKNSARDNKGQLVVGAAIGQNRNPLERAEKLIKAGIDMLVIDTAHGRNINFLKVIKEVRNSFPNIYIAAGNIDNPQAAIDFVKAGVNMLKVGIGPGGACKTRVQTGFGNPQISAVGFIKQALFENGMNEIKIIGDGGISRPGNLAKVLAAGADVGMIGSMFAGTDMTPGILREINGKLYKDFRGMASSYEAQIAAKLKGQEDENPYEPIFDEGANDILPYKGDGSFLHTIKVLHGSLASALSYANSTNLNEFYQKSKFGLQTMSGANEGRPHAFGN